MTIRIFEVGGSVRDQLLGMKSKDRDFAVEAPSWDAMRTHVHSIASKVFLEKPEFLTIRALIGKEARDFVLCRRDGAYSDARRPDTVEPGTILDDLARRDFTVNAIAIDEATREVLDPFGGREDIAARRLRCVGSAAARFQEDALRIMRAMRFAVTKGFAPDDEIKAVFADPEWAAHLQFVSRDRVREEIERCFKGNTPATLRFLSGMHPAYTDVIFGEDIWLQPTTASR